MNLEQKMRERRELKEKLNAELKAKVWEILAENLGEDYLEDIQGFEGTAKWEEKVMEVVDAINDVASEMETAIDEEREYYASGDAALDAGDAKFHEGR